MTSSSAVSLVICAVIALIFRAFYNLRRQPILDRVSSQLVVMRPILGAMAVAAAGFGLSAVGYLLAAGS